MDTLTRRRPVNLVVTIKRRKVGLDWKRGPARGTAGWRRGTMVSDGRCDALRRSVLVQGLSLPPGVRIPTRGKLGILLDPC